MFHGHMAFWGTKILTPASFWVWHMDGHGASAPNCKMHETMTIMQTFMLIVALPLKNP